MPDDRTILDSTKDGALVQFNLADVKGQINDQIRAFLLNMLPREVFDRAIENAWKRLTERTRVEKGARWNGSSHETIVEEGPSELETMVTDAMRTLLKERVATWAATWQRGAGDDVLNGTVENALDRIAQRAAQAHLRAVGAEIVTDALRNMGDLRQCRSCNAVGQAGSTCRKCGSYINN